MTKSPLPMTPLEFLLGLIAVTLLAWTILKNHPR